MSIGGHNFYQDFEQLIFLTFSGKNVIVLDDEVSFNYMHEKKGGQNLFFPKNKVKKWERYF